MTFSNVKVFRSFFFFLMRLGPNNDRFDLSASYAVRHFQVKLPPLKREKLGRIRHVRDLNSENAVEERRRSKMIVAVARTPIVPWYYHSVSFLLGRRFLQNLCHDFVDPARHRKNSSGYNSSLEAVFFPGVYRL